jgi:cytosine/adenosine deaminase-related metal-dependent hydrolase
LAAHEKSYREKVYKKMKEAELMVISCPFAWIDAYRDETLVPFHNALTPVDELFKHGITVAIGTDNIADYMLPFNDGDMWPELRLLAQGNRFLEVEELVKIATVNGRKVLGIS